MADQDDLSKTHYMRLEQNRYNTIGELVAEARKLELDPISRAVDQKDEDIGLKPKDFTETHRSYLQVLIHWGKGSQLDKYIINKPTPDGKDFTPYPRATYESMCKSLRDLYVGELGYIVPPETGTRLIGKSLFEIYEGLENVSEFISGKHLELQRNPNYGNVFAVKVIGSNPVGLYVEKNPMENRFFRTLANGRSTAIEPRDIGSIFQFHGNKPHTLSLVVTAVGQINGNGVDFPEFTVFKGGKSGADINRFILDAASWQGLSLEDKRKLPYSYVLKGSDKTGITQSQLVFDSNLFGGEV